MFPQRYDSVVGFVASVLFGASFREFSSVVSSLQNLGCSRAVAASTAVAFFAVFFRNVHGLIAYDTWAGRSGYEPSFEQRSGLLATNFVLAIFAAIILPYLFMYEVTHAGVAATMQPRVSLLGIGTLSNASNIAVMLASPVVLYFGWDTFWMCMLELHPDERHKAYLELYRFTLRWWRIDGIAAVIFVAIFILPAWFPIRVDTVSGVCLLYCWMVPAYLGADYYFHMAYYFPFPRRGEPKAILDASKSYDFSEAWEYILPDKLDFCHWGGRAMSDRIVRRLDVLPTDAVLELCCGRGGTLAMLPPAKRIVGIDISESAIDHAKARPGAERMELEKLDAFNLEKFADSTFDKVFVQDGDAWMHPAKHALMAGINRVTKNGGLFIYQSYVSTNSISQSAARDMSLALRMCGYTDTEVPRLDEIPRMFQLAGFSIDSIVPLHREYADDNLRMLDRLKENQARFSKNEFRTLNRLLEIEQKLFAEGSWSGVLVISKKNGEPQDNS